jgi:hypothetical protein
MKRVVSSLLSAVFIGKLACIAAFLLLSVFLIFRIPSQPAAITIHTASSQRKGEILDSAHNSTPDRESHQREQRLHGLRLESSSASFNFEFEDIIKYSSPQEVDPLGVRVRRKAEKYGKVSLSKDKPKRRHEWKNRNPYQEYGL